MMNIIYFLFLLLILPSYANATTYWVSPTGAAANLAACSGDTPLSGAAACSYDKANGSGVAAGDTVYYRAGTYNIPKSGTAINPYNTGTAGNIITFSSYNNEVVEFIGAADSANMVGNYTATTAVNLDSQCSSGPPATSCAIVRSYIKIHGLKFTNFMRHMWIRFGNHNEISHCEFIGLPESGNNYESVNGIWVATYIYRQANYNWIHHCKFGHWGYNGTYGNDTGAVFQVGVDVPATSTTEAMYNLVEDNEMYSGGHHVAGLMGSNNIYRNNYFHNEPWSPVESPVFATRTVYQTGQPGDAQWNLTENNRIGYGGPKNKDEIGGAGGTIGGGYNIWRYNTYVQIYTTGMWIYAYDRAVTYNHIYNNTFWHGGYGDYQSTGEGASANWDNSLTHPIVVAADSETNSNNVIKNNLFYQNKDIYGTSTSIVGYNNAEIQYQTISNNWMDNAGDPKFIDITGTPDPTNGAQWNFDLQSDSSVINAGAALTTASSAGNNTTSLAVVDAGYFFYDVGNMASAWPTANINNDWICVGTVSNCSQISSINYDENKITLSSALTWADNAPVWLYKKSDGTRVLYGSAPDMGAHERSKQKFTGNVMIGGSVDYD